MNTGKNLLKMMKDINYGYLDNKMEVSNNFNNFSTTYILQSPFELDKSKIGVCWDQVEYEREYFKQNNINSETYFLIYFGESNFPTHTFITFKEEEKHYWFEHSWEPYQGIHEYKSEIGLLRDVKLKFIKSESIDETNYQNIIIYKYYAPQYGISADEFQKHCEKGEKIEVDI